MLSNSLESEEEEDESSSPEMSPLDTMPNQLQAALDDFREKWQKELKSTSNSNKGTHLKQQNESNLLKTKPALGENLISTIDSTQFSEDEIKALNLFTQAVDLERKGKVYDALMFYKKAVQIDSMIEFKYYDMTIKSQADQALEISKNSKSEENNLGNLSDSEEDLSNVDLYARFQKELHKNQYFIKSTMADQNILSTMKHISDLPIEIIYNIIKWVVSSQLDIKSLENLAATCKGTYLCARDNELWRLICLKVWGVNTGVLKNTHYKSWREMYIERKRVHFHGCYISKTTYLRCGENSFQDQFYRPVQLIEYYRYFRFFPDGNVIMWTTAEEPSQAVYKLKITNQLKSEILKGHYRFHGDLVIIMLKRNLKQPAGYLKRRGSEIIDACGSYTYYIELKILNKGQKPFYQLQWNDYSIIHIKNKCETKTNFDLTSSKYPPLWFSRVKSYHIEADVPLQ